MSILAKYKFHPAASCIRKNCWNSKHSERCNYIIIGLYPFGNLTCFCLLHRVRFFTVFTLNVLLKRMEMDLRSWWVQLLAYLSTRLCQAQVFQSTPLPHLSHLHYLIILIILIQGHSIGNLAIQRRKKEPIFPSDSHPALMVHTLHSVALVNNLRGFCQLHEHFEQFCLPQTSAVQPIMQTFIVKYLKFFFRRYITTVVRYS